MVLAKRLDVLLQCSTDSCNACRLALSFLLGRAAQENVQGRLLPLHCSHGTSLALQSTQVTAAVAAHAQW